MLIIELNNGKELHLTLPEGVHVVDIWEEEEEEPINAIEAAPGTH